MSPATMTNDVETFDFSEEIRTFQARVETVFTSLNSDFNAANSAIRYLYHDTNTNGIKYTFKFVTLKISSSDFY